MLAHLKKLLDDENGFVVSIELVLIATILCLGMIVGLTEVSRAVTNELVDVANAYNHMNQGRRYQQMGWGQNRQDRPDIEVTGSGAVAEE
ncbi:MAG: hypothetical protein NT013_13150 [Planctomycetia bacterium]|nr:hypothetical protein [Planctomycetia bacterium]